MTIINTLLTQRGKSAPQTRVLQYTYDDSASKIFEEINPGNSVKGKIIFDAPKGTKLTSLEMHDSAFSVGVKVNL